jgi:hypothetical protein
LGERVLRIPAGRGRSWKRFRRRKIDRKTVNVLMCGSVDELKCEWVDLTPIIFWMDQRTIISKIPSSMMEKAQSSTEPKAMGVKIIKRMRMDLMRELIIAQSSMLKAQRKAKRSSKFNAESSK